MNLEQIRLDFAPEHDRLLMRIANPALMDQGDASLCGPTALVYNLATDRPIQYARYAIDLYETGKAAIGGLRIEPRPDCRAYLPPAGAIHPADWLTIHQMVREAVAKFLYEETHRRPLVLPVAVEV